jgi:diguanylate cyclase (GGDEF)-like protein
MNRGAILVALVAVSFPLAAGAAEPQPPIAPILAPLPGDVELASILRPAEYVSVFRVPHVDTALYIAAPWYVRDLTVVVVGPGTERRTFIATDDLPGHVLGLRLPSDAWSADRVELRATTVSALGAPYLIDADDLAVGGWHFWWYEALFGLFAALALVFGTLALAQRRRLFGWYAAAMAGQAGLMTPWLGIARPPPEISQPLHAAWQALAFVGLMGFALGYVQRANLPRVVTRAAWALALIGVVLVALGDVLQDFWTADTFEETCIALLMLSEVALGAIAIRRRIDGAWFFFAGTAFEAVTFTLAFIASFVPGDLAARLQDPAIGARGIEGLLLALAIIVPLRGDRARIGSRQDVDGLTGIANRDALDAWLAQSGTGSARGSRTAAAVLLDVDRFRAYNDTYGHAAGDDALRRVAAAVAHGGWGPDDLAGRYGDDQFLVLLGAADLTAVKRAGAELVGAVAALEIAHGAVPSKRLSVSIGVASIVTGPGDRIELIRRASAALYLAKTMGRNRVVADEPKASAISGR